MDIGVKRSAEIHVDHLSAATDAENRKPLRNREFHNVQLEFVPFGINPYERPDFCAVQGRIDVVATTQHQTVEIGKLQTLPGLEADRGAFARHRERQLNHHIRLPR